MKLHLSMPSRSNNGTSISWLRVIGFISIVCSLLLSLAILWYLAIIEVPATESLQDQVLFQADTLSILARVTSSSTPPHAMR